MAQYDYRANLGAAGFPLLSEKMGPSIIVSSNRATNISENKDIPHVYYCHNVMPTAEGMNSVGFTTTIAAASPAVTDFAEVKIVYGNARSRLHLAWTTTGEVYSLKPGEVTWLKLADTSPSTVGAGFSTSDVTVGRVNGKTYIWYLGVGCFTYNEATDVLDNVTLTGLTIADIVGITASSGYLIAYTTTAVAWSSTVDPTDFTPSTVTGAGGGSVAGIGGNIKFMLPNNLGFLAYSDTNVISGSFTDRVNYPFKFREVNNSKGGISLDYVAHEANTTSQYAFTTAGMQATTSQSASLLLPEVTDFLSGKRFEDFDTATNTFQITDLTATMQKKIKLISSRYLVISYGITEFTHALVYDIVLERLGKIKHTHVDCFEYVGSQDEVAKESLAFVSKTGEVDVVDFAVQTTSTGVLILGKFQYTRGRFMILQGVELENIETGSTLAVTSLSAIDGKNYTAYSGYEMYTEDNIRNYTFDVSAKNHSILLAGQFNLVSATIIFTQGGKW